MCLWIFLLIVFVFVSVFVYAIVFVFVSLKLWGQRWCEGEQMWGEFYAKSQIAVDGIHQILFTLNSFCLRPPAFQRYF